jgi:predicted nucleic acid-binding protein
MRILLDSNVLLRLSLPNHPHSADAANAVELLQSRHQCVISPQAIYEFWVVATRPTDVNGLGYSPELAARERDWFLQLFNLLRDERAVYERWQELVDSYQIKGVRAHDVRYVAALQRHAITHFLTFNARDFRHFSGVVVLTPQQVITQQAANPAFIETLS